jgi:hypothetical protein
VICQGKRENPVYFTRREIRRRKRRAVHNSWLDERPKERICAKRDENLASFPSCSRSSGGRVGGKGGENYYLSILIMSLLCCYCFFFLRYYLCVVVNTREYTCTLTQPWKRSFGGVRDPKCGVFTCQSCLYVSQLRDNAGSSQTSNKRRFEPNRKLMWSLDNQIKEGLINENVLCQSKAPTVDAEWAKLTVVPDLVFCSSQNRTWRIISCATDNSDNRI